MMFPNDYPYNPYAYGIAPYQVAQNPNLRQGDQDPYYEMDNHWGAVPVMGSTPNNFNHSVMLGGYPDPRGLGWNGFTNMNSFPPLSGASFPPNGVDFAPSYSGIGSNSGPPNSAVPIPDVMLPNDTSHLMPPRGEPACLIGASEKQTPPQEKSKTPIDHISPASSDPLDETSVGASSWDEGERALASLLGDNTPLGLVTSSVEPEVPGLAVSLKSPDIPFNMIDKLSMEATRLSTIADGLSSTMSQLSDVMSELPATAGKLADTASDLSQTVTLISSKADGIASFPEDPRIQQIFDTVDSLAETVSEMVKRERIVMEAFSSRNEKPERSKVPFQFQNKATRKRK
ncbi:unnamed protein product [Penicillium egyptiacum]|uniref:Uncharacterized protein n=1 Tax=Penicillium egyptiacum TaxID=1303716 RepID=A0A9W4KCV6_9EURO|nr:unnamed protein product [Penicillium egyptiacum]